jgi:hypothetical protein
MIMWGALHYVETGLSLVAFLVAAILWAYRAHLTHRAKIIKTAPEQERLEAIATTAEFFRVDVSGLTRAQQTDIVLAQIDARARRHLLWAVMSLVVFVLLAAITMVSIWPSKTGLDENRIGGREVDRANIKVLNFVTEKIQAQRGGPLTGWGIQVAFRNFGKTDGKHVLIAYSHYFYVQSVWRPIDMTPVFTPDDAAVDLPPGGDIGSEFQQFGIAVFDEIKSEKLDLLLFGEVSYNDIFPGTDPHISEFCVRVRVRGDHHDANSPAGMGAGPFQFASCTFHNASH